MHLRLLYKKFLCVFMSLMIVIFSTQSAYAVTSTGGWTALDTVTAGATNTINAAKTAGGKALKSSITVAASASKVGKYLIKGGGQAALAYAMVELADGALDWVLDPANNSVKWKVSSAGTDDAGNLDPKVWYFNPVRADGDRKYTASGACKIYGAYHSDHTWKSYTYTFNARTDTCSFDVVYKDSRYPPSVDKKVLSRHPDKWLPSDTAANDREKSIPIDVVAAKVIANAEAGHAPSQEAVKATALEGFAAGEHDAALDAAAVPDTGVENPPDTENPPKDGEAVPFDPSSILAALSSISAVLAGIMSALTGFVDWWQAQWATFSTGITEFFQWVRAEPDVESLKPEPVEVSDGTLVDGWQDKANAGYVNMGNTQCPADVLIPISYMGASTNLSLSYVPFCHFASIIRYAVILGAWVAALMIISGGRTRE